MNAEPRMTFCRKAFLTGACLAILACGSSEPDSPLILGGEARKADVGPRTLTASQSRALREVVTRGGEFCVELDGTYLRDAGADGEFESWEVRCNDGAGAYMVVIRSDGSAADVRRCVGRYSIDDQGCSPGSRYRDRSDRAPTALNPELGKLLEPMTAKDAKVD